MSRVVPFIILGGLVIAVVTAIDIGGVNAQEDTKFISVSVLSKKQANYAADKNLIAIPAVSADILEDKVRDTERQSSVPIIRYTSLPVEKEESADQGDAQPANPGEPNNNQGNNGNGNSNQNMNNNGNGNADGGNDNSNHGKEKEKEKETKPDKGNAAERKISESKDKPDKGSSSSNVNSNEIGNSSNGTNQDSKPEKKK